MEHWAGVALEVGRTRLFGEKDMKITSVSEAVIFHVSLVFKKSGSDPNGTVFSCLERNTDVFALEAGRSLSWPDSYQSFQHGIFLLASPEQQQTGVYPGGAAGGSPALALQGEVLSFLLS